MGFQQAFAALVASLLMLFSSCFEQLGLALHGEPPVFVVPVQDQLSSIGLVAASLKLPDDAVPGSLQVTLDGVDVTGIFVPGPPGEPLEATLTVTATGSHELVARVDVDAVGTTMERSNSTRFETIQLADADRCEVLNALECMLPYPSARFQAAADTETGWQLDFPEGLTPPFLTATGIQPLSPEPYRVLDGYSPAVNVLMHFPGGVDLAQSGASRLLSETRSYDDSSLDEDHPTILIDADTGERVLHFLENDARAVDSATGIPSARQITFLRPAEHLKPGHRYIVAVRRLVHADGSAVAPEAPFRALRDGNRVTIPGVAAERRRIRRILGDLRRAGLGDAELGELILAFDFTVASQENTTGEMLSMRDQALDWLAQQDQTVAPTFTVDELASEDFDCSQPGQLVARIVRGSFEAPLFTTADPVSEVGMIGFLSLDENDVPSQVGITNPPFSILIPCAALDPAAPEPFRPVVLGHGLGMTGDEFLSAIETLSGELPESSEGLFDVVLGATDWHGLSGPDFDGVMELSGFLGAIFLNFDDFAALPDRLRQSQVNTVLLARMLRDGAFNVDPWFQNDVGVGILPGRSEPAFYFGVSLGGIMGTFLAALTPDIERFNVDVGASNFSLLLSRATPFRELEDVLFAFTQPDVTLQALGVQIIQELWTRGEPAGYARFVTGLNDPSLPGSIPKKMLMTVARFDHQVSNQASEIMARTLRIPSLVGSAEPGKPGIPDLPGPLDSALVYYDAGGLDPALHPADVPPLDNRRVARGNCDPHSSRLTTPASLDQLFTFLQPSGEIVNFCDGVCDGRDGFGARLPDEIPGGADEPCLPDPQPES